MPSTIENRESFEARRTFLPGWNFVPRCITMMLPAVTNSPPYRLTPRYLGFESRPLREEPTPFLRAMRASADLHVGDLDFGEILAMPRLAAIAGAAREAEDANLLPLAVTDHFGGDLRALDGRLTGLDVLAVGGKQHPVERHLASRLGVEQRDLDGDAFFGAKLLAAG